MKQILPSYEVNSQEDKLTESPKNHALVAEELQQNCSQTSLEPQSPQRQLNNSQSIKECPPPPRKKPLKRLYDEITPTTLNFDDAESLNYPLLTESNIKQATTQISVQNKKYKQDDQISQLSFEQSPFQSQQPLSQQSQDHSAQKQSHRYYPYMSSVAKRTMSAAKSQRQLSNPKLNSKLQTIKSLINTNGSQQNNASQQNNSSQQNNASQQIQSSKQAHEQQIRDMLQKQISEFDNSRQKQKEQQQQFKLQKTDQQHFNNNKQLIKTNRNLKLQNIMEEQSLGQNAKVKQKLQDDLTVQGRQNQDKPNKDLIKLKFGGQRYSQQQQFEQNQDINQNTTPDQQLLQDKIPQDSLQSQQQLQQRHYSSQEPPQDESLRERGTATEAQLNDNQIRGLVEGDQENSVQDTKYFTPYMQGQRKQEHEQEETSDHTEQDNNTTDENEHQQQSEKQKNRITPQQIYKQPNTIRNLFASPQSSKASANTNFATPAYLQQQFEKFQRSQQKSSYNSSYNTDSHFDINQQNWLQQSVSKPQLQSKMKFFDVLNQDYGSNKNTPYFTALKDQKDQQNHESNFTSPDKSERSQFNLQAFLEVQQSKSGSQNKNASSILNTKRKQKYEDNFNEESYTQIQRSKKTARKLDL